MSVVSLLGVNVKNNPAKFTDPYEFEITFECLESLQKDLEWKLTYVGSATSAEHDQELDSLLVGPIPVGVNKFIFEADPPDTKRIPDNEILGVTVILLTCAYDDREFVRVGYYVNNEYDSEELIANPPAKPLLERVKRSILAEKPRVTRFAIKWDSEASAPPEYPPEQPEADLAVDEEEYGAEEAEEEEEEDEAEETAVDADANGDSNMDGVEAPAGEGEASDAESEDIGESDESDEEEAEDEEMDDAMEVDAAAKPEGTNGEAHHADDAMAH